MIHKAIMATLSVALVSTAPLHALQVDPADEAASQGDPMEEAAVPSTDQPRTAESKVYWPDEITPERVMEARRQASMQEQISREREQALLKQLTQGGDAGTDTTQVSTNDGSEALAQLSASEREVLLEAVEGSDICERDDNPAVIRKLCEDRIETRSAEFAARPVNTLSAEERLLGEGLDGDRVNSLERAVDRLGRRNTGDTRDPDNQAIASMALEQRDTPLADSSAEAADAAGAGELSPETQALVDAIVEQFGGGSGSSQP